MFKIVCTNLKVLLCLPSQELEVSRSLGVSVVIIISSQLELSGLSLGWVKTAALPPLLGWWWCDCICLVMAPPQLIKLQHDREQVAPHPGLIPYPHQHFYTPATQMLEFAGDQSGCSSSAAHIKYGISRLQSLIQIQRVNVVGDYYYFPQKYDLA